MAISELLGYQYLEHSALILVIYGLGMKKISWDDQNPPETRTGSNEEPSSLNLTRWNQMFNVYTIYKVHSWLMFDDNTDMHMLLCI